MPLHLYSQVSAEFPNLNPGWSRGDGSVVFSNPRFGTIFHVAVCNEVGQPLYDQPVWSEPSGAVVIPVDEVGKIAFVENYRAIAAPSDTIEVQLPLTADLLRRGRFSLELPRGFAEAGESSKDTAIRETQEETGCKVIDAVCVGQTNANTTFFLNDMPIWLVHVTRSQGVPDTPDVYESIKGVHFLDIKDAIARVKSGEISCGITKAALLHYLVLL